VQVPLLTELPTPFVTIDHARVTANIATMQALAGQAGVGLRPHTKTHKSVEIARWQRDAGARGICCAKLSEAEIFADAGFTDIRLPYPVNPANADRVAALLKRGVGLSIIVDDLEVARGWSAAMVAAGQRLDVLVKVDVGFHRCGIDPDSPNALSMVKGVSDLAGLSLRGLLSHAGQSYNAGSIQELGDIATQEIAILRAIATRAREAGVELQEISVGSTPTARFITLQKGATEMRPGNYVFFDRTQVGLRATALESCALSVVSTVVSRPAPARVVFDAGSKTLTSDGVRGFGAPTGHGLVFTDLESAQPDGTIAIERLSEEHAVARVPATCRLKPGDRVRIIPNHACTVTNLANELVLAGGLTVIDRLQVSARGRNY
jgi:D-serine deaminase-like pyridoxal phosphate-dependent protein